MGVLHSYLVYCFFSHLNNFKFSTMTVTFLKSVKGVLAANTMQKKIRFQIAIFVHHTTTKS